MKNLHDRWAKDCSTFRELYNQMPDLGLKPKINWGPLLDEKQVSYKIYLQFIIYKFTNIYVFTKGLRLVTIKIYPAFIWAMDTQNVEQVENMLE